MTTPPDQTPPAVNPNPLTEPGDYLMTPEEVAAIFRVDPKTVTRWAQAGKIKCHRTIGGHRRYAASEVRQFAKPQEGPTHCGKCGRRLDHCKCGPS